MNKLSKLSIVFVLLLSFTRAWAQDKGILSSICTPEVLSERLVPYNDFTPVPRYGSSYWKDSIPEVMRRSYIAEAEKYIGKPWESVNISLFSDFRDNGDRDGYQNFIFAKRNKLMALAMGEIMEGKGRFLKDIMNGMFSVCEETWWGVPAHYSTDIPQPDRQTLALFSAETAGMMSWMYYMFKEPIRKFSPLLEKRVLSEISRRVLTEAENKKEWWRTAVMNWNPWICSNWMSCVLLAEPDRTKQIKHMRMILASLDAFIDGYPDDGGCDEGAHYWDRAAGSLFDCLNLLGMATGGYVNLSSNAKVRQMGDYLCKMNIGNGYFVNFADAGPRLTPQVNWFPSAIYLGNKELLSMTANSAIEGGYFTNPAAVYTTPYLYLFFRELVLLSHLSQLEAAKGANVLLFDSWLPRIQVLTARSVNDSVQGLFLAAKGGNNAESHNHNDVGSFIVYADGQPLFIDPGVGTYRKETFNNATRYNIWCMQSAYHNLPQINGVDQKFGKQYAASDVIADIERRKVRFSLDIAKAYPAEAGVTSWKRTIDFVRNKSITVTEAYKLSENNGPTSLMFMSCLEPHVSDGVVSYKVGDREYGLYFTPSKLKATVEKLELDDKKFIDMWGEVYRLKLELRSKSKSGRVKYTIREIKKKQ